MSSKQQYVLDFYVDKYTRLDRESITRNSVANAIRQARLHGWPVKRRHWTSGHKAIEIKHNGTTQRYFEAPAR